MRGPDPIDDYSRYDRECADDESLCPVCDICGEPIMDDFYYEVGGVTFHLGCAECHSVESYMEKERERRWTSRQR